MIRRAPHLSAGLLVLLAACTDAVTIPSTAPDAAAPRFSESGAGAAVLGSRTLSYPFPQWMPVAALPQSEWIVVDVRGTIGYEMNTACRELPPAWRWTTFALHGLAAGPLRGPIYPYIGSGPGSRSSLWPVDGTAETATHARMLMFVTQPGTTLGAYMGGGAGMCGNPTWGGYASAYFISGGYEVTATRIPAPIEITTPERVLKNMPVQFSVQPYGDLRWVNPYGAPLPQGRRSWYFFPGDTMGEPVQGFAGPHRPIPDCFNEPVCTYAPDVSGRMLVAGYVEGWPVAWKSEIVRVVDAEVKLECTEKVERGRSISCTTSTTGDVTTTGWRFNGVDRTEDPTASTWGGDMVISGTIEVLARNGSTPLSATAEVEVTDRTWPTAPLVSVREIPNGTDRRLRVASRIDFAHDLGVANWFRRARYEDNNPDPIGYVSGGPNDGLHYFEDLSFPVHALYVINRAAMMRGSAFYNAQVADRSGGGTTIGGINWCSRSVVSGPLPGLVEAHELRHIEVYTASFRAQLPPVLPSLEPMVGTYQELYDAYDILYKRIDGAARAASNAIHADDRNPNNVVPSNFRGRCALKNESGTQLENRT